MDFQKQAEDFLKKHGLIFEATFVRHGNMSWDGEKPEQTRDIYRLTVKRENERVGKRSYKIDEYGQSIANSGEWIVKDKNPKFTRVFHDKSLAYSWHHRIKSTHGVKKNPNKKAPTAYDLFTSLTKIDPGTFEDFCSDFGYDTDSRKALATYEQVKEDFLNVLRFFSYEQLEELQEIN